MTKGPMPSRTPIEPPVGELLSVSREELDRARRRVAQPAWAGAAEALRQKAESLVSHPPPMPTFDCSWYDADPQRDFAQTYDLFHAYTGPASRKLMPAARTLLVAGLVFDEEPYLHLAMEWALRAAAVRCHVRHHDAGMEFGLLGENLAEVYTALFERFAEPQRQTLRSALTACGQAVLENHRHWETVLARMPYNNHLFCHRMTVLSMGLALGRRDWTNWVMEGPRPLGDLLAGATYDDGLCYESSTRYHFVTARFLAHMAELFLRHPQTGFDLYGRTFANGRTVKQLLDAPLELLFPGGEPPALGDCYAERRPLRETEAGLYELAYARHGDGRYAWLLNRSAGRTNLEALLYGVDHLPPGEPVPCRSQLWVRHGYARVVAPATSGEPVGCHGCAVQQPCGTPVRRSTAANSAAVAPASEATGGFAAFLTGDANGIHSHRDKLSLQVFAAGRLWTEDAESRHVGPGHAFAASIQKAFNRAALAHNLVVVDEEDQRETDSPLPIVEFAATPSCHTMAMADSEGRLAAGATMMRSVAVTKDYCLDVFQVASDRQRTYDWAVHPRADGPAECELPFAPLSLPDRPCYSVLREAHSAPVGSEGPRLAWRQGEQRFEVHVTAGMPGMLLRALWPVASDWSAGGREMFLYRVQAARADFVALYQAGAGGWRIASARRFFNGQRDEIVVEVSRGEETCRHVLAAMP